MGNVTVKFIDLEGKSGTVIADHIVHMRDYEGASFKTVITLSNDQDNPRTEGNN